jgi:hypothetical protein
MDFAVREPDNRLRLDAQPIARQRLVEQLDQSCVARRTIGAGATPGAQLHSNRIGYAAFSRNTADV